MSKNIKTRLMAFITSIIMTVAFVGIDMGDDWIDDMYVYAAGAGVGKCTIADHNGRFTRWEEIEDNPKVDTALMSDEIKDMINNEARVPGIAKIPTFDRQKGSGTEFVLDGTTSANGDYWPSKYTPEDIETMEEFARQHFTSDMTVADKLLVVHQWIHYNNTYGKLDAGGPDYAEVDRCSYIDAIFNHKVGQCVQYNGAMAAWLTYFGFKAYMVKGYVGSNQHYWCEAYIGGKRWYFETGCSTRNGDSWQYFCSPADSSEHTYTAKTNSDEPGPTGDYPYQGGELEVDENICGPAKSKGLNSPSTTQAFNELENSWVDIKDMFRHGGALADENAGGEMVQWKKGMATGEYAINLIDGSYFWYHQTSSGCGCTYCGTWTSMTWGSGGTFGTDGCAQYSMAIILSNITGQAVTPDDWLTAQGCVINDSHTHCDTGPSSTITGHCVASYEGTLAKAKEKYAIEYTEDLGALSSSEAQAKVDEVLGEKDGLVWMKYSTSGVNKTWWPTFSTSMHFIAIRNKAPNGEYYLIDECLSVENMNKTVSWDQIWSAVHGTETTTLYGLWNPNPPMIAVGGGNGSWYSSASNIKQDTAGTEIGAGVKIYKGLPWKATSGTFVCDTDAMTRDMISYVNSLGGAQATDMNGNAVTFEKVAGSSRWLDDISRDNNSTHGISAFSDVGGGQVATVDGVKAVGICVPPTYINPKYNVAFGNYDSATGMNYWSQKQTPDASEYEYGTKKLAVVFKGSDGSVYYLPATCCDAKAHTFPGGVVQTSIRLDSASKLNSDGSVESFGKLTRALNNSGSSSDTKTGLKPSQLGAVLNEAVYSSSNVTVWDCIHNVAEFWNLPDSVDSYLSNNNLRVIGVVSWGDGSIADVIKSASNSTNKSGSTSSTSSVNTSSLIDSGISFQGTYYCYGVQKSGGSGRSLVPCVTTANSDGIKGSVACRSIYEKYKYNYTKSSSRTKVYLEIPDYPAMNGYYWVDDYCRDSGVIDFFYINASECPFQNAGRIYNIHCWVVP